MIKEKENVKKALELPSIYKRMKVKRIEVRGDRTLDGPIRPEGRLSS